MSGSCRRYLVSGRVQGVFFRASARDMARQLGLAGYAANRRDGRVEVVACGTEDALDRFRDWLHQGPPQAEVDGVEQEAAEDPGLAAFEVR